MTDFTEEIKTMQATLLLQGEALKGLDGRTAKLEKRAIAEDAARKAIEQMEAKQRNLHSTDIKAKELRSRTELWVKLAALATLATAAFYAWLGMKGLHT